MSATAPRDSTALEVRDALAQPGCPVCRLALRTVRRYLGSVAYEQVNDPGVRSDLRAARGFCNQHAFRWLREARSVLGTAIIYRDVLQAALEYLEAGRTSDGARGWLGALLGRADEGEARAVCPACRVQREAEARYLSALLEVVGDPPGAEAFEHSDGLCLGHVLSAARMGGPSAGVLLQGTSQRVQQLVAALDEVVRKEDYRFRHEPRSEAERTAPARAVAWAAGAEGLVPSE